MRIGWLADDPGYVGGAEMTAAEFRLAAPKGIEVIDCPPGGVVPGLDRYVAHNVTAYHAADMDAVHPVTWYHHDVSPHVRPSVREWLNQRGQHIFCSPLQRDRLELDGPCIPPPLDIDSLRPPRQSKRHREGACSIAQWRTPGKGARAVGEWAQEHGPLDVYGAGAYVPSAPNVIDRGPLDPSKVAQTLWGYERFVFLPFELEPFGRCVVEAWLAGCKLTINGLIGARHWIQQDPGALETAAEDFWRVVLDG